MQVSTIQHVNVASEYKVLHAILRSGKYACRFDNFYESSRQMEVIDLETNVILKRFRCEVGEAICCFRAPYFVTRKEGNIRIWNINNDSSEPDKTIETGIKKIQRVDMQGKTLIIIASDYEYMYPRHIYIFRDFEKAADGFNDSEEADKTLAYMMDKEIDLDSSLLICDNTLIYSTHFGVLKIVDLTTLNLIKYSMAEDELKQYVEELTKYMESEDEDLLDPYEANIVKSLIRDGNNLVGSTDRAIKVWNATTFALVKEIPNDEKVSYYLHSLEGCLLFGCNYMGVKIWDIVKGKVIYSAEGVFPSGGNIPSLTLYNRKIYRLDYQKIERPAIALEEEEELKEHAATRAEAPRAGNKRTRSWLPSCAIL